MTFTSQLINSVVIVSEQLRDSAIQISSVQSLSLYLTLYSPVCCNTRGFPQFSSVQFSCSVMSDFLQPHGIQHTRLPCPSLSQRSLKHMSVESVMPSDNLILSHPLLLLPSIFPSNRVFSNESALRIKWPKYWSFSFSISPSNEYSGLISFRIDWFDLLAVQGTLGLLIVILIINTHF